MLSKIDNSNIIARVYQNLKLLVMSHQFPAGERLNIETLAENLRVSITPVRETLLRLVAEGLIINVPKMGFFMKTLSETDIRDLYEINHLLMIWSMGRLIDSKVPGIIIGMPELAGLDKLLALPRRPTDNTIATSSGAIFEYCARRAGNREIVERIKNINDRLNYIRVCESRIQAEPAMPLLEIIKQGIDGNYEELQELFREQHAQSIKLLQHVMRLEVSTELAGSEESVATNVDLRTK